MKVVSLFTGAGGLDLGLEAAGLTTVVAVEFDALAARTLRSNRDFPVFDADIHEVESPELRSAAEVSIGETDLVVGGPPCQPFSKSAFWRTGDTARLDDPRASTLEQYLRVIRDLQPKAFLLENVPGLGYKKKDEGLQLLLRTIEDINREQGTSYRPSWTVLNAADFGVPQERRRLFIVAEREGREFVFPTPTHGPDEENGQLSGLHQPYLRAWDAIGGVEVEDPTGLAMTGKWARLLPSIPEGQNYLHHTARGEGLPLFGWRRRFWSFLLKLSKARPSWTLTAQPGSAIGPFHWANRRLSIEEMARLQTFPRGYRIHGSWHGGVRQLGNAVPSALAEALGRAIRSQLLDGQTFDAPLTLIPTRAKDVPPPEPVAPVPDEYLPLAGEHAAHPGTGLGPGAG